MVVYAPLESPAVFGCSVTVPAPVPAGLPTVSHAGIAGSIAVHAGEPASKATGTVAVEPSVIVMGGEVELSFEGAGTEPAKSTLTVAVTVLPTSLTPVIV